MLFCAGLSPHVELISSCYLNQGYISLNIMCNTNGSLRYTALYICGFKDIQLQMDRCDMPQGMPSAVCHLLSSKHYFSAFHPESNESVYLGPQLHKFVKP
jgi:hypothetical protein